MANSRIFTGQFIFIWLVNFFIFMAFQMLIPTIPVYANQTFVDDSIVGLVVGFYTLAALIFRPISSFLLEQRGEKVYILVSLLLFGLVSCSYLGVKTLLAFLFLRLIHGAAWGVSTTATSTIASYYIPPQKRGEGMGYFTLSQNLAMAIGPGLGLYLVSSYSFKSLFVTSLAFSIAAFSVMLFIGRYKEQDEIVTSVSFSKMPFEKKSLVPSIILFLSTLIMGAFVSFIPLYAAARNVGHVGMYFAVFAAVLVITRPFIGKFADKNGSLGITIAGLFSVILALILIFNLRSLTILIVAAIFWGFGFGTVHPLMQAAAVNSAPENKSGVNATFWTFYDLGIGLGAIIAGFIANYFGYAVVYLTFIIFPFIAMSLLFRYKHLFTLSSGKSRKVRAERCSFLE